MAKGRMLAAEIGFIDLVGPGGEADHQQHIDEIQNTIRSLIAKGAKGWALDVRRDGGGNVWPMLAGIGSLSGGGELGAFMGQESVQKKWRYDSGIVRCQNYASGEMEIVTRASNPVPLLNTQMTPIAILQSDLTSASGEIVIVSFSGRPRLRTFGLPTAGQRASALSDRSGYTYAGAIKPDERVEVDWERYGTRDDPVLRAALGWLRGQL